MTEDFAELPNLNDESFRELVRNAPDDGLGRALKRILEGLDDPDGVISAFQSFANPMP